MRLDELYQMALLRFSENAPGAFPRVWQKVPKFFLDFHHLFSPVHIDDRG